MIGSNRINGVALLCTCAGNAMILGGIAWGLTMMSQPMRRDATRSALVVTLLPLDKMGAKHSVASTGVAALPPSSRPVSPQPALHGTLKAPVQQPIVGGVSLAAPHSVDAAAGAETPAAEASLLSDYQRRLRDLIASNTRYPAEARPARLSGVTALAFRLARSGRVLESWVLNSSGSIELDTAALDALERAQPLIPIPAGLPDSLSFVVEIDSSAAAELSR